MNSGQKRHSLITCVAACKGFTGFFFFLKRQPESELEKGQPRRTCFFMHDLAVCKMRMETEAAARCDPRQVWGLAELTPSWPKKVECLLSFPAMRDRLR